MAGNQVTETDVTEFLEDMEAGTFMNQLAVAISRVADGVVTNGRKGQVQITLDVKQIADSASIHVTHSLKYVEPTGRGEITEKTGSATPFHVNQGGKVTLYPEHQGQLFQKDGVPNQGEQSASKQSSSNEDQQ